MRKVVQAALDQCGVLHEADQAQLADRRAGGDLVLGPARGRRSAGRRAAGRGRRGVPRARRRGGLRVQAWCHLQFRPVTAGAHLCVTSWCASKLAILVATFPGKLAQCARTASLPPSWSCRPGAGHGRRAGPRARDQRAHGPPGPRGPGHGGRPRLLPARTGRRVGADRRRAHRPERVDRRRGPGALPHRRACPPPPPRFGRPCASSCGRSRRPSASTPRPPPVRSCATRRGGTTPCPRRRTHLEALQHAVIEGVQVELDYRGRDGTRLVAHRASAGTRGQEQHLVPRGRHRGRPADLPGEPGAIDGTDGEPAVRPDDFDLAQAWSSIVTTVDSQRAPVRVRLRADTGDRRSPALHVRQPGRGRRGGTGRADGGGATGPVRGDGGAPAGRLRRAVEVVAPGERAAPPGGHRPRARARHT